MTGSPSVAAERLAAQLLAGSPAPSAEAVVRRLLAIQAQDPRGFRLAVRSRSAGVVAADIDRALTVDRSLVVTWLNRGTLHLVTSDDYWWLHPLTTPQLGAANRRRLREEHLTEAQAERGVGIVTDALSADGPLNREQLRERLDGAGVLTAGQALVHVLLAASIRGHVVRGPIVDGHHAFVPATDWLGAPPPPLDDDEALARLARRYLEGHGPAAPADLAKWAGITLGRARRGFESIADDTIARDGGLVVLAPVADAGPAPHPPPRLLGPFDPLLHGWASRAMFVGAHGGVVTSNGVFRPVALVDGRVIATWGLADGFVTIRLRETIPSSARQALEADAADVLRFLGLTERTAKVSGPEP